MSKQDLLLDLIGLACGVGSGAYLVLVLHVVSVTRGVYRRVLALLWPAHFVLLLWIALISIPAALGPSYGGYTARLCYLFLWLLPLGASVLWYRRTHPDPLQTDWGKRNERPEQSLMPAPLPTETAADRRQTARSGGAVHYCLAATGCGIGLILYLLLSRRAFLDYYLAALGCGVGLALYLLLFMRALRLARGRRRMVLRRLWLPSLMLYAPLLVALRVAGKRLGLVGDYAAEIGTPLLLGLAPAAALLWYTRKYPTPRSRELAKRGE